MPSSPATAVQRRALWRSSADAHCAARLGDVTRCCVTQSRTQGSYVARLGGQAVLRLQTLRYGSGSGAGRLLNFL